MLNVWTVIRYSGAPWHSDKWKCARDVLDAVYEDSSHGGGNHDSAKMLLHNSKVVVIDDLSGLAFKYGFFRSNRSKETGAKIDHFAGAGKMVGRLISRLFAGGNGPFYGILEAAPLAVSQAGLEVPRAPVFRAVFVGFLEPFKGNATRRRQIIATHAHLPVLMNL